MGSCWLVAAAMESSRAIGSEVARSHMIEVLNYVPDAFLLVPIAIGMRGGQFCG